MWSSLERAIHHRTLDCAFQPIVCAGTGSLAGFEALLRWNDPRYGPVGPELVSELVARQRRTVELDLFMIGVAARSLDAIIGTLDTSEPIVSVNIAPQSLDWPGFADAVLATILSEVADPSGLVLELTEHSAVSDWIGAQRNVAALQTAGVLIALDDFGTGTSNLRYMNEFDVDYVKLDRSFITGPLTPRRRSLVASVVDLTREHGARLIAEGVETSESSRMMADLGVDFIQGFIHGRPESIETHLGV